MYFQDFSSLIHMNGHGLYVWSTYGIGLLIIAYNVLAPRWIRKKTIAGIKRQASREASRHQDTSALLKTDKGSLR